MAFPARVTALVVSFLTGVACAGGPREAPLATPRSPTSPAIAEEDARQRLYAIADDSMGGRPTGSPGHHLVTEYLAAELVRLGLTPGGENGSYFQPVPLVRWRLAGDSLVVGSERFRLWTDYVPGTVDGPIRSYDGAEVVYGGILQDTALEITREQAAGKFVILLNRDANPGANMRTGPAGSRLETAAAVATVNSSQGMEIWTRVVGRPSPEFRVAPAEQAQPAVLAISVETANRLMGRAVDTLLPLGTRGRIVRGGYRFREEAVEARNVIAVLPGSDPARRGTYVAIGAHSDHIPPRFSPVDHDSLHAFGILARRKTLEVGGRRLTAGERAAIRVNLDSLRALRPPRRDSINNGADDDGSGTVALLEIAEALATARPRPARSVLFVWHVGEELGLLGSRHFTEHPTIPRDSIVAQLNLDMIGRGGEGEEPGGGPGYLQLIGWRRLSSELSSVITEVNRSQEQPFTFDLQYDAAGHPEQYYCRSDHYMYARYGIPIAFFTTGGHGDYHQVSDEPQYIDYTKLTRVARLVHDVARRLADLDHRPLVDGPRPDPQGDCVQ